MTHATRFVAAVAVLTALVLCVPVQAQTPLIERWRGLAEEGVAESQHNLGVMYQFGDGVPQDYVQAAGWYRRAADQGLAEAQANLGFMYEYGRGVPQDYMEAVRLYRLAADP